MPIEHKVLVPIEHKVLVPIEHKVLVPIEHKVLVPRNKTLKNLVSSLILCSAVYFSKPLRLLWIGVCFIVCDSSFFLLCSLPSLTVVHYACDCSCT